MTDTDAELLSACAEVLLTYPESWIVSKIARALQARLSGGAVALVCTGCGSTKSMEYYTSRGFLTCCPERDMQPPAPSTPAPSEVAAEVADLERVARAVCPIVKPWMDAADTPRDVKCDCRGRFEDEQYGPCVTACYSVCEDVARAAMSILHTTAPVGPVDMILHCPKCGFQHVDAPDDPRKGVWDNPPHRSHLCHGCRHIWRPADVATNGVAAIKTKGSADSSPVQPAPVGTGATGATGAELTQGMVCDVAELAVAIAEAAALIPNGTTWEDRADILAKAIISSGIIVAVPGRHEIKAILDDFETNDGRVDALLAFITGRVAK